MPNPSLPNQPSPATASAGAIAANVLRKGKPKATEGDAIRPFRVDIPEADLVELRRRVEAARWPDRETVRDSSQGVQLATIQKLAQHWKTKYDWRKIEAKLNALPNFITNYRRTGHPFRSCALEA